MNGLWIVFLSVFIAELGDKTQLATLTFSIDQQINKWGIFAASSLALVLSSLIAVVVGSQLTHWINPKMLKIIAGLGFIGIGIFTLLSIKSWTRRESRQCGIRADPPLSHSLDSAQLRVIFSSISNE